MAVLTVNTSRLAYTHEAVTTLTSSTGLTSSNYEVNVSTNAPYDRVRRAEEVLITVETAAIRFTIDGTTPTVTAGTGLGHLLAAGDALVIVGFQNIKNFRAINAVASSGAAIRATFYR